MSQNKPYIRQIPLIGEEGQAALNRATVFIAGAGGLGSPVALYLAVAGVGTIRIADMDCVDTSNLNRQILHPENRIGTSKAESAKKTIEAYNPACHVDAYNEKIDEESIIRMIGTADLIIDCLDNFDTRYVLNRAALTINKQLLHGAVAGYSGQLTLVVPGKTPCLSCIFPHAGTTEAPAVLGATCGIIGSMQALEAIRVLTGKPTLAGKLLVYDGMTNSLSTFDVKKSSRCPVCGEKII